MYCDQLDKLNDSLKQKRPELINRKGIVFHHDNARPHTSLVTRQKLLQLEWDVLPHPPYSPDLAPSDYYLFRSLQKFLDGKTFTSNQDVKYHLDQFLPAKIRSFMSVESRNDFPNNPIFHVIYFISSVLEYLLVVPLYFNLFIKY